MSDGPVDGLLLLHGFAGSARIWDSIREPMASIRRLVSPDWPGYGTRSALEPLRGLEAMAGFALDEADRAGLRRFDVIGHSMSGFVVQQLLLQAPERIGRAVLYGSGLRVDPTRRFEPLHATIARLQADGIDATVRRIAATWFAQGTTANAYPTCIEAGRTMSLQAAIASMIAFETTDFSSRLSKVTRPTLVIAGDQERTFPPEMAVQLWRALPAAELCILPNVGHAAHLETPGRFAEVVAGFLGQQI